MTFREKLADLISGGALTRAEAEGAEAWLFACFYVGTLEDIATMETPGANATVRRMAKTAREALG